MKISSIKSVMNFKGATININALSDIHGHIEKCDRAYQTMQKHNVFEPEKKGTANYLIIGGDWFISGDRKGYKSAPNKPLMGFQLDMYNKFVGSIKQKFPKLISLFIPGNHDFDGGRKCFKEVAKNIDSTILSTNLDKNNSKYLADEIKTGHIVESYIDFVSDDKKANVSYPVLNLGISPVNMSYYKKYLSGINFTDNIPQAQKTVKPEQYKKTSERVNSLINDFKNKYPNGIVVLTSHTGVDFAQNCAKEGNIDLIFNAHEHKEEIEQINGTPIINLSQNFNKIVNAKIKLDDDGKKHNILIKSMNPNEETISTESSIGEYYDELFKEDSKKIYTIRCTNPLLTELSTEGIRYENNHLANFVTGILLEQAQKINPLIDIFALNSSSIRGGFHLSDDKNTTHAEVLNCLDGINTSQSDVYVTDVWGEELIMLIMDNFVFNMADKEKNPIIQYAGITIDKTNMLEDYHNGKSFKDLCKYIKLTSTGEQINPNFIYRIANPKKYFEKSNSEEIRNKIYSSTPLNKNVHELFENYFAEHNTITYVPETRLY